MKIRNCAILLSVILGTVSLSALVPLPNGVSAYTPHTPIYIYGNENFTAENGVVSGSGTWDDPYVISGWEIPVSTGRAIYIENASVHFRIENVYIHGATSGPGIFLFRSSNGTISNSLMENNFISAFFWLSSNITASDMNIAGFEIGIRIANSSYVSVSNISFHSNRRFLDIRNSLFVSVFNNTANAGGLLIDGSTISHFNTHEIPENNTVRGRPIRYLKDCDNLRLDDIEAAQIILANCSKVSLSNLSISETEMALELAFVRDSVVSSSYLSKSFIGVLEVYSNNITYHDVTVSEVSNHAVRIRHSNDTTFSDCTIGFSYEGIELSFSHNLTVRRLNFHSIIGFGVGSMYSSHILLEDNSFHGMIHGFIHWTGNNLTILRNGFKNVDIAIEVDRANGSYLVGNFVTDSGRALLMGHSNHTTIEQNVVTNIRVRGFETWYMTNCTLRRNRINRVSESGLFILYSANNVFYENSIIDSLAGIGIFESRNNDIFHNNLINNSIQAFDNSANDNDWDNGYPSGGNYWSNYTGPDDFSGPNQDIPGSDEIRDIPFEFDLDTKDDYPLMSPVIALPPDPPTDLTAELTGEGFENVTLSWNLSVDEVNGLRSVVGYDILRGTDYSSDPSGYLLYDSIPEGTSQYVDIGAGDGDPNNYFYVVCAVDLNDNSSCSQEQATKFTRSLSQGPNLISVPLLQANESIERTLQTVEYDKAWYYDSSSREWKWDMKDKAYKGGLRNVNHTIGLWVNVTEDSNLTVAGLVPSQTTVHLHEGWNLISFPSYNPTYAISDLKAEVGATRVEGYVSMPPYYLRVLGDLCILQAGHGYWIRVEADTLWTIEVA